MGLITYTSPGTQVTQSEYDANFTTIYNEFNGNIENTNISATAAIVDTKLATITTSGKVSESALPGTYANSTTFSGGVVISGGALSVTGGVTVVDVGLTVTAGGLTITAGGATITSGDLNVQSGAVNISGTNGIDYNFGGTDGNVDIATVTVTGTPKLSWGETADRFLINKGLDISAGGMTLTSGSVVLTSGNLTLTSGNLTLTSGNFLLSSGSATISGANGIDYTPATDSSVDIATINVTGTPIMKWDETADKFSINKGLNLTAGGLTLTAGGVTLTLGDLTLTSGDLNMTSGDLNVQNGAVNISGVNGIDLLPGSDLSVNMITVGVTGTPALSWSEVNDYFNFNNTLNIASGGLIVSGNISVTGTVDGVDVSTHDTASTGVHGVGGGTIATTANITTDIATHAALDTGVHGSGANTLATDADISTHAALSTGVHGSGGNTLATDADISTHAALTTGVHGAGGDTLATDADITTHANLTTGVHSSPIAFSVHKNGVNQDESGGGTFTVTWSTENFDIGSDFASNIHTPGEAGKYFYSVQLKLTETGGTDPLSIRIEFVKNSTVVARTREIAIVASASNVLSLNWLEKMNGSTDTMKVQIVNTDFGIPRIEGTSVLTFFHGHKQAFSDNT